MEFYIKSLNKSAIVIPVSNEWVVYINLYKNDGMYIHFSFFSNDIETLMNLTKIENFEVLFNEEYLNNLKIFIKTPISKLLYLDSQISITEKPKKKYAINLLKNLKKRLKEVINEC